MESTGGMSDRAGSGVIVLFLFVSCVMALSHPSMAKGTEEDRYTLDIEASPVDVALILLARATGRSLIIPTGDEFNVSSRALKGSYTLLDALDTMLQGTGLSAGLTESGAIVVSLHQEEREDGGDMKRAGTISASIASALVAAPGAASAQAPDEGSAADGTIESIIVTAKRRQQSSQDVPITISALSGDDLYVRGITSAEGIVGQFPNVSSSASNSITTNFNIRGIATDLFQGNVNRSVGVYIDDVTQAHAFTGTYGLYDMERIEILRGPQNTLNGRNTTGGAINFISVKPTIGAGPNGYARITYGRFDRLELEGAFGADLSESVAVRLAGQRQSQSGPFENLVPGREGEELGERDNSSVRAQLLWAPGEATNVLASVRWGRNRGKETGNISNGILDPAVDLGPTSEAATAADDAVLLPVCTQDFSDYNRSSPCVDMSGRPNRANFNDRQLYNAGSGLADVDVIGATLRVDHVFRGITFTSITAYDELETRLQDDLTGWESLQAIANQDIAQEAFQQELRLVSPGEGSVRWIAGVYYYREDLAQTVAVRQDQNPVNPNPAVTFGQQIVPFNFLDQVDEEISVFGELEFDLSDRFTLSAGLRFTNNSKEADSLFGIVLAPLVDRVALGPNAPLGTVRGVPTTEFTGREYVEGQLQAAQEAGVLRVLGAGPPPFISDNFSDGPRYGIAPSGDRLAQEIDRTTGDLTVSYRMTDTSNVFFRYARGFKSGGFDTRALASLTGSAANIPTDPEQIDAYELGLKSNPTRSLQANASIFYYDQKDLQVFDNGPLGPQFLNLPKSRVRGVEVDTVWAATDTTRFTFAAGYLDAKITDIGMLTTVDEGHDMRNAPEFSFNLGVRQDFDVRGRPLTVNAAYRYIGKQTDSLLFSQDFYSTKEPQGYLDLRATLFLGADERFQVSVFGENLTGENYCADIGSNSPIDTAVASGFFVADSPFGPTVNCQPGNAGVPLWGIALQASF
ncbi:MAG TPA: TonB-dependent receptor [Woeseiaceae bacterium]|nr:TonB-dependent receptor [Woeseiaceae bacterium]